jgi:hypothetical protein
MIGFTLTVAAALQAAPAASPPPPPATREECAAMFERGLGELGLGYRDFDQKTDRGWRPLRLRGCNREALDLIGRYAHRNAAALRENEKANLNFHSAQVALAEDLSGRAQYYLQHSYLPGDTASLSLDWNAYVAATYAFVTGDRAGFDRSFQRLAARRVPVPNCAEGGECTRPDSNLPAVERLRRCWGRPYRIAYFCPE